MKKGILLIALNSKQYAEFATNMAASIRLYNPTLPIHLAVSGDLFSYVEWRKVFDSISIVPVDMYIRNDRFEPGWCKMNMDKLTPFDWTLYLDVDGCVLRDLNPLFMYEGFKSQVVGSFNTGDTWPCQWMTMDEVRRTYDVEVGRGIEEINSSLIVFDQSASDVFELARSLYREQHNGRWGGAFPDELAFNVALCKLGRSASLGFLPIKFEPDGSKLNRIQSEYYVLGLYGGVLSRMVTHYNYYDMIVQVAARSCGFTPHKAHHLIRHKHVQTSKQFKPKQIIAPVSDALNVADLPIFIGVTTMNRPELLEKTLRLIQRNTPGATVFVYDDCSTNQSAVRDVCNKYGAKLYASDKRNGVAYAKNMCLNEFMLSGLPYAFLFDDDCRPIVPNWWQPYIESGLNHCTLSFDRLRSGRRNGNEVIGRSGSVEYYNNPCGVMLFYTRECIDRVGGMDLGYGLYGHEHVGHSYRIYNAGLTESPFLNLSGSIKWFESDDYNSTARSTYRKPNANDSLRDEEKESADWKPLAQGRYVLGALFGQVDNPQGERYKLDAASKWAESVYKFGYTPILFTDMPGEVKYAKIVKISCYKVPNTYRFVVLAEYIRKYLRQSEVWCTDTTDVVMLNEPKCKEGVVYVGSESSGWEWMQSTSEGCPFWDEVKQGGILYNCGIIGGIGKGVLDVMFLMSGLAQICTGLHDMHCLNWIIQNDTVRTIQTGAPVHNRFKSYKGKSEWFMHK